MYVIKTENGFIGLNRGTEVITNFKNCIKFTNFENAIGFSSGLIDDYDVVQILDEKEVSNFEK